MHSGYIVIVVLLILFSFYRRIRRNIGWQRIGRRLWIRAGLLGVLGLFIGISAATAHPDNMLFEILGLAVGGVVAYVAARNTRFEERQDHPMYLPNTWIGIAVTAVFLGRFLFRFNALYSVMTHPPQTAGTKSSAAAAYPTDPWTMGLFLMLMTYYVGYYAFVLWKGRHMAVTAPR